MNRLLEKLKIASPNLLRLLSWMMIGFLVSAFLMPPAFAEQSSFNPISVEILNETNKESEQLDEKIAVPQGMLPFNPESKKRIFTLQNSLNIAFIYHPSIQRSFAD